MRTYLSVWPGQIRTEEFVDPLGSVYYLDVYTFLVEATRSFSGAAAIFIAHFCDADGIEVSRTPVEFVPMHFDWRPGTRSRVRILLPAARTLRSVRLVRVRDIFGQ